MADVISEYQKWKQQGENLKTQAKQAMESRFRELLTEAVSLAEEYRADFGATLKPSSPVTSFRYKVSGKPKKKAQKQPEPKPVEPARADPKGQEFNPKIVRLKKQLVTAKKKLEDAKSAGTATRVWEDRIYEIEDSLRLANQAG